MYEERFGLSGSPFRLNPDPKFFFGSRSHNKAMAYLHYGLRQSEGFIVITGEIGAGKSMLIGHLLDQLDRSNIVAANLPTSSLEPAALLAHILSAFRIEPSGAGKSAEIEAFEDFLFDQMNRGRRVLLIVDEAQNLPLKTIEELRMLSNMDYDGTPLFQVFLIGQPEFRATIAKPDMEQLRQRVIATYHLNPLDADETRDYILHRLEIVGWRNNPSIAPGAFAAIHAATGGLPRKINALCNRLFLYCALENEAALDERVVGAVVADMAAEARGARRRPVDADAPPFVADEPPSVLESPNRDPLQAERPRIDAIPVWTPPKAPEPLPSQEAVPPAPQPQAVVAPVGPRAAAPVGASMFDRLRALKSGAPAPQNPPAFSLNGPALAALEPAPVIPDAPPEPATLVDVAKAIAEAQDRAPPADSESPTEDAPGFDEPEIEPAPAANGWRQTVLNSIAETRDDLKTAHANVARLRRRLVEIDRRRSERRTRVTANLDKAEMILAEIRNVWR